MGKLPSTTALDDGRWNLRVEQRDHMATCTLFVLFTTHFTGRPGTIIFYLDLANPT